MSEDGARHRAWTVGILTHLAYAILLAIGGLLDSPGLAWVCVLAVTLVWFLTIGKQTTGFFFGILIDSRNRISLSRAQMVAWSIVVLSGYAAAAFCNIGREVNNPLAIRIPEEMWLLIGISTTSLVSSPFLLNIKQDSNSGDNVLQKEQKREAAFADMVSGEAEGNHEYVDLAKVQMLFFTVVIALAYCAALGGLFRGLSEGEAVRELPGVDKGLLALMGISHAGYLAAKPLRSKPRPADTEVVRGSPAAATESADRPGKQEVGS